LTEIAVDGTPLPRELSARTLTEYVIPAVRVRLLEVVAEVVVRAVPPDGVYSMV
jgi:hypothetical protein